MSSTILDLSLSRGPAAADTSSVCSGAPSSPATSPPSTPLPRPELRVSTTDRQHARASTPKTPDNAATPEPEMTDPGDVSDDVRSRDAVSRPYPPYWDYQAAAAARFLVPFLPSPAGATGSSPMTSPLNFYNPFSPFPALPPAPPDAVGFRLRPDGAAENRSRSTEVKDECGGGGVMTSSTSTSGHVTADPTYAERRRKNNEAARRSRDARRMKERETCLRAALLQQENVRLRAEMAVLKTEVARLHCLLYEKM